VEHIAMTEEEIITALAVTGGSSDDGKHFKELLNQSLAVGIEVKEVIAGMAYSGRDNLAEMKSNEIRPVVPLNPVVHKSLVFYFDTEKCKVCPLREGYLNQGRKARRILSEL
jgi:hypothetical protein